MALPGPENTSVDDVREALRRLGYLDSGLDRFVIGDAGRASTFGAALKVAARVGIVGGIVQGIALALVAVSLEPERLSRPSDLATLALYLSVLLGLATFLGTFAIVSVAAALARALGRKPTERLPRVVDAAFVAAGLAYLALWWRSHGSAAPLLSQAVFVAIGAAIALLLGRFGALASLAVLSAGGLIDPLPASTLSGRRMLPLAMLATVVFGGSLAMASYLDARGEEAPDFAVVPTGIHVRVIGIDGLERQMTDQMLGRGEMPQLAALMAKAARASLAAEPEQVPAIVWTTIATGRGPEAHGIRSAEARRLAGMSPAAAIGGSPLGASFARATELLRLTRAAPPSAVLRGAKTFWNVASEKGLRVGVVNWWASWPADAVNGFVVTDRALLKLERHGTNERDVHPPEAFVRLAPLAGVRDTSRPRQLDRFHTAASLELSRGQAPDLEAVYLNGLDVFTMQTLDPDTGGLGALSARLEDVRAYHRFLDGLVGELVAGTAPADVIVIVGDPGRFGRRATQGAEGLLLMAGGPIAPGEMSAATERDIAPTVLHLLGLPVSRELTGNVLERGLEASFRARHPVRIVDSYGRRPRARATESSFDKAVIEELRSLGYIQ